MEAQSLGMFNNKQALHTTQFLVDWDNNTLQVGPLIYFWFGCDVSRISNSHTNTSIFFNAGLSSKSRSCFRIIHQLSRKAPLGTFPSYIIVFLLG